MIEAKETLIGNIASSSSLSGSLNKATEYIDPITQEKAATPTKEQQVIVPDDGYTGLSKVTVEPIPDNYIEPNGTIDITKDGQYNVSQYANANVDFDTSDATAEAGDIASGKTAYTKDGLIEGTGTMAQVIEKGIIINGCDADGYANDVTIAGITKIPQNYFSASGRYSSSTYRGWFSGENAKLKLLGNITSLGNNAFSANPTLTRVEMPDTITSLGTSAFENCTLLTMDKLPESLKTIGTYAFRYCSALNINKIPKNVTSIQQEAFYSCTSLTEITFEGNITNLNYSAIFGGCTNFKKVSFPNNTVVPTLHARAFGSTSYLEVIEVPSALLDTWKTAANWSNYADIIVGI